MNYVNGAIDVATKFYEIGTNVIVKRFVGDVGAIENMLLTVRKLTDKCKDLSKATQMKLLLDYKTLQDMMIMKAPQLIFGPLKGHTYPILSYEEEFELSQIAGDCNFYCRFAAGAYGDAINYVFSGTNVIKAFDWNDRRDEFVKLAKIDDNQLVFAQGQASTYEPAHAICVLKEKKEVILLIRGTASAGDLVTDLVASYVNLSVMEDPNGNRYIRINSRENERDSSSVFKDTRFFIYNKTAEETLNEDASKDKELYRGKAHSGIFLAGLEIFNKMRERVEDAFKKLPKDYNFRITGHSLGGGTTQVLTFLFLIHPLKYFAGVKDLHERVKGYAFAPPPLFSKDLAPILDGFLINVVNNLDCVPRLNYGTLKDIDSVVADLSEREKSDELLKNVQLFNYFKRDYAMTEQELTELEHYKDVYKTLKSEVINNEKLNQLGRTFLLMKREEHLIDLPNSRKKISYYFEEIQPDTCLVDIILCLNMLPYHSPNLYQEGLCNDIVYR